MTANNGKKLKIAITGGIASGKSTVSKIISELGFRVYSADVIYSQLLENEDFAKKCCDFLGINPLTINGKATFDRIAAAEKIFEDSSLRLSFNEFTHAHVYRQIDKIFDIETGELVFFEVPLLFESGKEDLFDRVIVVKRDIEARVESAAKRDGKDREYIKKVVKSQFDYDNSLDSRHTIIYNDGDKKSLCEKVKKVVEDIRSTI